MGKNLAFMLLKRQVGTAEGWLRLLKEHLLPNHAHAIYCPKCDRPRSWGPLPPGTDISKCWRCGESVLLLDGAFYSALSKFLKHCYRYDRSLFARARTGFPDSPFPEFEGVLAWLKAAWDNAPKPRGRPQETRLHLFIASWVESLTAPRFDLEVKKAGPPTVLRIKPLMSFVEAIEVLQGNYPSVGQTLYKPSGRRRKFGGLDSDTLRQIHEEFTKSALEKFGAIPSLATRDVLRIRRWYRRWREAKYRIQGNKVRGK